jgi:hypothetical protein
MLIIGDGSASPGAHGRMSSGREMKSWMDELIVVLR